MFEWLASPQAWLSLATLAGLEIVLGIDNIIFITLLVGRLPKHQQDRGRVLGLGFAMLTRIALLFSLFLIMKLTKPLFSIAGLGITGRDLVLILGGLFLIFKSAKELKELIYHTHEQNAPSKKQSGFWGTIAQIAIIDIVFSLDSVITAVGMANHIEIMVLAVMIAVGVMMFASKAISVFIDRHESLKVLALAFLLLVGGVLVLDGLSLHINKAYIYSAMGFSLAVEALNILRASKRA